MGDEYDFVPYEDNEELPRTIPENEAVDARGKPISQQSVTDMLINTEVLLPHGEKLLAAKVNTIFDGRRWQGDWRVQ